MKCIGAFSEAEPDKLHLRMQASEIVKWTQMHVPTNIKARDEAATLRDYVEDNCLKVAKGVMRDLQGISDTQSGTDSGLRNAWDEICVQRQGEESFLWDYYDETVRQCISRRLSKLPRNLLILMWFEADTSGAEDDSEYDEDELAYFIAGDYVYRLAEAYSNKRIERYLWE